MLFQSGKGTAYASSKVSLLGQTPETGPDEPVTSFICIPNLPQGGILLFPEALHVRHLYEAGVNLPLQVHRLPGA